MTTIDLVWGAISGEWQTFLLLASCVALFIYFERDKPSANALAGIASYTFAIASMSAWGLWDTSTNEGLHDAYEAWASGISVALVCYVAAQFIWPRQQGDTLGFMVWVIIIFAEAWTAGMENIACNFLAVDIPRELQTPEQMELSVCERVYGWWYRYPPLMAQIAVLFWFASRWNWARLRAS